MKYKVKAKVETIDAIQYTGDNYEELETFVPDSLLSLENGIPMLMTAGTKNPINKGDYILTHDGREYIKSAEKDFNARYEK